MFEDQLWIVAAAVLGVLGLLVGVLAFLLIRVAFAFKDIQMRDLRNERDSYESMSLQMVGYLETLANRKRHGEGVGPLPVVAPVIPEHNSPITVLQQDAANLATLRARLVVVTDALGLPPRTAPDD